MLLYILTAFTFFYSLAWSFPFLLTRIYCNYQLFMVKDKDVIKILQKKIKLSSIETESKNPYGLFIGRYYIGIFIEKERNQSTVYIFCTKEKFIELTLNTNQNTEREKESVNLIERSKGSYDWIFYTKRTLEFYPERFIKKDNQTDIIIQIEKFYKDNNNNCISYINGLPGSGKSTIGLLLAKHMKGTLCNTFNPTDPGDSLSGIYNDTDPSPESPLILLIDEVDIIIDKIHNNNIQKHKNIQTQIYDKITWNLFLDNIDIGLYPNLIIIFTSNISCEKLCKRTDKSYFRKGRVNLSFELGNKETKLKIFSIRKYFKNCKINF